MTTYQRHMQNIVLDLQADLIEVRAERDRLREALRDAEGWLTQGRGSPECHYALGIIRSALNAGPKEDERG